MGYNRRRSISGLFPFANDVAAELLYHRDIERGGVFECGEEGVDLGCLGGFSVCGGWCWGGGERSGGRRAFGSLEVRADTVGGAREPVVVEDPTVFSAVRAVGFSLVAGAFTGASGFGVGMGGGEVGDEGEVLWLQFAASVTLLAYALVLAAALVGIEGSGSGCYSGFLVVGQVGDEVGDLGPDVEGG